MKIIAKLRAERGDILRSGAAPGADDAFEQGCLSVGGKKEIFLPWDKFNGRRWNPKEGYFEGNESLNDILYDLVKKYHPHGSTLSRAIRSLMMRNCHQILGWSLNSKVEQVLMYAPEIKMDKVGKICDCSGGTGFAVRLAYSLDIPIYSMGIPSHIRFLMRDFM